MNTSIVRQNDANQQVTKRVKGTRGKLQSFFDLLALLRATMSEQDYQEYCAIVREEEIARTAR